MIRSRRRVVLAQLPIPQPGLEPARGNVPLAAGYLKLYARKRGLEEFYDIDIFPTPAANTLSDLGLVEALLDRDPWMVGFSCYLWNIDRTLWVAQKLKERRPGLKIILGGPEVTADNAWVLDRPEIDYAAVGEGEQTFTELLQALLQHDEPPEPIAGLSMGGKQGRVMPLFRKPLPNLNEVSSPYLEGILDAADEEMLFLETIRGCIFKCKFCYYPKSYDDLYFLSEERIVANLQHARDRGAHEVVLLDPTLNQRKDFASFVKLLAACNVDRQFTYFGELRAEGIQPEIAGLLRDANFTEVEIGLQSVDPLAQELMDRKNNIKAFERGVRALREAGIRVKVDLIIGLPGDTVESVRRGMAYLRDSGLYDSVQVFNLAILPGTAFRQEAPDLGLEFQPRPPYYVLRTPTLDLPDFYQLMAEAQEIFETEFDPLPSPELPPPEVPASNFEADGLARSVQIDLDVGEGVDDLPPAAVRCQAFTLWLKSSDFRVHAVAAQALVARLLDDNPHSTLQVLLEPAGDPEHVTLDFLDSLRRTCFRGTSYLDRFYSILPGRMKAAKRLVVLLPLSERNQVDPQWISDVGESAAVLWLGTDVALEELEEHEYVTAE